MIARTWETAEFPFPVHPYIYGTPAGISLQTTGRTYVQHYLGHKNIQHTVHSTELSPERFKSFWED